MSKFGDSKTVFSVEKLVKFTQDDAANKDAALTLSTDYLCTYFAHGASGNKLFYTPPHTLSESETFETIQNSDMKKRVFDYVDIVSWEVDKGYTPKDVKEIDGEGRVVFKTKAVKVSLKQRFYERHQQMLHVCCDPHQPRFFSCPKSEAQYINLSQSIAEGLPPTPVTPLNSEIEMLRDEVEMLNQQLRLMCQEKAELLKERKVILRIRRQPKPEEIEEIEEAVEEAVKKQHKGTYPGFNVEKQKARAAATAKLGGDISLEAVLKLVE